MITEISQMYHGIASGSLLYIKDRSNLYIISDIDEAFLRYTK